MFYVGTPVHNIQKELKFIPYACPWLIQNHSIYKSISATYTTNNNNIIKSHQKKIKNTWSQAPRTKPAQVKQTKNVGNLDGLNFD